MSPGRPVLATVSLAAAPRGFSLVAAGCTPAYCTAGVVWAVSWRCSRFSLMVWRVRQSCASWVALVWLDQRAAAAGLLPDAPADAAFLVGLWGAPSSAACTCFPPRFWEPFFPEPSGGFAAALAASSGAKHPSSAIAHLCARA